MSSVPDTIGFVCRIVVLVIQLWSAIVPASKTELIARHGINGSQYRDWAAPCMCGGMLAATE
jgi:hypothetical protein